jgi:nucleotide-binding universal stress UspA family protein
MGRIVVGVDGSEGSLTALRWAVEEAARRQATLDVVTTWTYPALAALPVPSPTLSELSHMAWTTMDRSLTRVRTNPGVRVERHVVQGHAVGTLLDVAQGADLLVVGRGGRLGGRVGSTSFRCAMHAPCPVVVVPQVA